MYKIKKLLGRREERGWELEELNLSTRRKGRNHELMAVSWSVARNRVVSIITSPALSKTIHLLPLVSENIWYN